MQNMNSKTVFDYVFHLSIVFGSYGCLAENYAGKSYHFFGRIHVSSTYV